MVVIFRNWKKKKVKTKKLSKITILDEQEPSVQSADITKAVQVWSWGNRYSPKPGNWPTQHLYLKVNNGCHARGNLSEETISKNNQKKNKLLNEEVSDASAKAFIFRTLYMLR